MSVGAAWRRVVRFDWRRQDGRPSLLSEVCLLFALEEAYSLAVGLSRASATHAYANARGVLSVERWLGVAVERDASRLLWMHPAAAGAASLYYTTVQWVSGLVLVMGWLWWRHPDRFRWYRRALYGSTLVGLIVFVVFPVAPPRLADPGVVDVVAGLGTVANFHRGALASLADEYGAMPSIHVAWAVVCCAAVWPVWHGHEARALVRRTAGVALVVVTSLVVVFTGNHFVLDVVAGAADAGLLVAVASWMAAAESRARSRARNATQGDDRYAVTH